LTIVIIRFACISVFEIYQGASTTVWRTLF